MANGAEVKVTDLPKNSISGWGVLKTIYHLYYNSPQVRLSVLSNCRSQFSPDLLGRCLKLSVSAESISCHEFAFQFGLAIFLCEKLPKSRGNRVGSACIYFNDPASCYECQRSGRSRLVADE